MAVSLTVNGTDRTKYVERSSLYIQNILSTQVDTAKFTIQKYGDKTFEPVVGQEVVVMNGATKIFAGIIIKVTQGAQDYKVIRFDVECEDYTRLLDRRLVADTFTNKTIGEIIDSIKTSYLPTFTSTHVEGTDKVIAYIAFNYTPVSQAIQQLADLISYDWYVDYDKDIHFFAKDSRDAPISLSDDDGSYIFDSLKIRRDNSQLRNRIFVRGGDYLADTLTTEFISDGYQNLWTLGYKYDELKVSVTGEVWSQGIDGVDAQSLYDYIWNPDEKFIRFRGDRIPSDTSHFRVSGQPYLPVRVVIEDEASIADTLSAEGGVGDGVYEYLIIDNSINSREGARERASAELESYKDTLSEGSFTTYQDGLIAGQTITINSTAHGLNESFLINRVTARMRTFDELQYEISLVTTKTMGIIEFLQSLLVKDTKKIVVNDNEVVDLVYAKSESMAISETTVISKTHNPVSETLTFEESVTEHAVDYPVEFVVGDLTPPSGYKRVFIVDGSYLG